MALEPATIEILAGPPPGDTVRDTIRVLFNPSEYSIERANTYKSTSIPGLSGPLLHFINGEADTLSMELFIDDYTDAPPPGFKNVEESLAAMASLLEIDSDLHGPPPVRFIWGRLHFTAIIEKLSRKITLFRPDGTAARATLNVAFKEYRTLPELIRTPPLKSSDKSKRRVIVGLDSLWALAAREYGDPALWRLIADKNDIDDPRDVASGDWVTVPPLEHGNGTR